MKIILGGGLSGLIWAYYHSDCFILSDQIGGQMNSAFELGPRYLHNKSSLVGEFLMSLDLPTKLRTIKVGYVDGDKFVQNPDLLFRQKYFMKSRGQYTLEGFDSTVLNSNISEFEAYDVDFKEMTFKLFEKLADRIYMGKAQSINLKDHLVKTDSNMTFGFENLVSTIPLNIFGRISGLNLDLKSYDMSYCLLPNNTVDIRDFDYVYDASRFSSYHRITRAKQGYVADILTSKLKEFIASNSEQHFSIPNENVVTLKNSQIISLEKNFELDDKSIRFLGRYGAWNRKYKVETVIEEAQT